MYVKIRRTLKAWFYQLPLLWKMLETLQGVLYVAQYYYYYRWPGKEKRFSLKEINIEFASHCNLRCRFCSLDHTKPKRLITEDVLHAIFRELLSDKRFHRVEIIHLHNGGEVLLHPKRLELLALIQSYKEEARRRKIPFPKIYMLTNGMLLRKELSQQILSLGVLDVLGLSFDGGTPELFEAMRENARWTIFYQNVLDFYELNQAQKNPVKLYGITCVPGDRPLTTEWMHSEFQILYRRMNWYELRRLHNWAGEIEAVKSPEKKHKIGCSLLMQQMVILPDGNVTVCCNDLNAKGLIGNIHRNSLYAIYCSAERRRYLDLLLKGKKAELALCAACETF